MSADSEVLAIRRIDLTCKIVQTIVGKGLFVFGHKNGWLEETKFQHPIGVTTCEVNKIYVTDTYDQSVRLIDFVEQTVLTQMGKWEMKFMCNADDHSCVTLRLFEPSDVKICGNLLHSPDTNNHLVRIFGLNKKGSRH